MESNYFYFIFHSTSYKVRYPFHGQNDISIQVQQKLIFDPNHQYNVNSDVNDEIFHSFIDYLNKGQKPDIRADNIHEYQILNEEFHLLTKFINECEENLSGDLINVKNLFGNEKIRDRSFYEEHISQNLDLYLEKYPEEMSSIPINSLYNIFNCTKRVLTNHEIAYQFIKTNEQKNQHFCILLNSLDGNQISEESQIECNLSADEKNYGFKPKGLIPIGFKNELNELKETINSQQVELRELKNKITNLEVAFQDKNKEFCIFTYLSQNEKVPPPEYFDVKA